MSDLVLTDLPAVALAPLTKTEAEAFAAFYGVKLRYRLVEWLRCRACYEAHREDGCRFAVSSNRVSVTCRCGTREFVAPKGTSDLGGNRSNSALVLGNQSDVVVVDGQGVTHTLKGIRIEPEDAAIIRFYDRVVGSLGLNCNLAFRDCYRAPFDVFACELLVNPSQVAIRCNHPDLTPNCRIIHYSGSSTAH